MPQTEERNLELAPRTVETRERRSSRTVQFELDAIVSRFDNTLTSIKSQFIVADQLKANGNIHYKDILRSQIVFLDSAFDFFISQLIRSTNNCSSHNS